VWWEGGVNEVKGEIEEDKGAIRPIFCVHIRAGVIISFNYKDYYGIPKSILIQRLTLADE
jgi:hypothetical protein